MEKRKIIKCTIEQGRYRNTIHVTYEDNTEEILLKYYPDEISFSEHEIIGLTRTQVCQLYYQKDLAYLKS